LRSDLTPLEVRDRVQEMIKQSARLRGIAFEHRLEVSMGGEEVHFYSPQLVVKVEPATTLTADGVHDTTGSLLHARFGPDPYVWAFYVMGAGMLTLVTILAAIFGLVQLTLHQSPTALYVAPGAAFVAALVYGASFVGQGLGYEQMYFLRTTLTETVQGRDEPD
jgi:hypothetical protein